MARPCARQLEDQPVDLLLGADVDAAGRLVEQQHARARRQPLADHDLLLVAARERAGPPARCRCSGSPSRSHRVPRQRRTRWPSARRPSRASRSGEGQGDVVRDRKSTRCRPVRLRSSVTNAMPEPAARPPATRSSTARRRAGSRPRARPPPTPKIVSRISVRPGAEQPADAAGSRPPGRSKPTPSRTRRQPCARRRSASAPRPPARPGPASPRRSAAPRPARARPSP